MKNKRVPILACAFLIGVALISGVSCAEDGDSPDDVWTDSASGLTWQVGPGSGHVNWFEAAAYCDELVWAGRDDWRLPTVSELRTLIRDCDGTMAGGACRVTDSCTSAACQNDACYSCDYGAGPSDGCYGPPELPGGCEYDWSSSSIPDSPGRAWAVGFTSGFVYKPRVYYAFHARCVR